MYKSYVWLELYRLCTCYSNFPAQIVATYPVVRLVVVFRVMMIVCIPVQDGSGLGARQDSEVIRSGCMEQCAPVQSCKNQADDRSMYRNCLVYRYNPQHLQQIIVCSVYVATSRSWLLVNVVPLRIPGHLA